MTILCIWAYMLSFYVLYIAAINLVEDWEFVTLWLKLLVWPIPLVMIGLFDIPFNLIAGTVLFLDLPQEWTLTSRLARYRSLGFAPGIRKRVATTICTEALNPFAPSKKHC